MKRLVLLLVASSMSMAAQSERDMTYSSITKGQVISGFQTLAVYLNDADGPIGARFAHARSGFTLDLLTIQSVPQAFVWVTTYPTSDMGEPHTQEHLLLGKGNAGRAVASQEAMSLASSSAFTAQFITAYHFYTSAGSEIFYGEFQRRMDALLHPDYTDEEVRREVRNFGITEDSSQGLFGLEEKGSVYNEMVSSMDQPNRRLYMTANRMTYGDSHPLAFNAGGTPEALRLLQPSHIRDFHSAHYHLANMGAIVSVPREMVLRDVLTKLDAVLNLVQPDRPDRPVRTERDLPAARPSPAGAIRFVEYPHRNEQQPGTVVLTWPADRDLDVAEQTLLSLFLEAFAGDATTNLYKMFIDSRTREIELGAQSVFSSFDEYGGFPVLIGFGDVPVAKMTEATLDDLRSRVLAELERVVNWKDGSPELAGFNQRVLSRIIETRRSLAKFVNTPPGFGFRGTGYGWWSQLALLNKTPEFHKSITLKPILNEIERALSEDRNIWRSYLSRWKLTGANPWALAAKPNPALIGLAQTEREARLAAELARLKLQYGADGDQEALKRYRADYEAETAKLDAAARSQKPPKFIDNPPMTLDDQLDFRVARFGGDIPLVVSTFDSMTSATAGIALRLDGIEQSQLVLVSILPSLLTRVGVIENGKPVPYEEMSERIRKEILSLGADFSTNSKTDRVELVVRGSGNDASESKRAVEWMQLALFHPDWRVENLPRIRDVVDQALSALRRTMQTAEENWVRGVANAWWRQDSPLLLTTTSFLTQVHNVQRLRWMLMNASTEERAAGIQALRQMASLRLSRADLKARLETLKTGKDRLLAEAAKDLDLTLPDIPDSSLAMDWTHLCNEMAEDLATGPQKTLATLDALRRGLLKTGTARIFLVASSATQQELIPEIDRVVVAGLDRTAAQKASYAPTPRIAARLRERNPQAGETLFAALLHPNSQGGVFLHSAPGATFEDTDRERILDYLASGLYSGGGGHSLFMKTWGAGLAYSNGVSSNLHLGRLSYYAERTPELPQTMRFVVREIQGADYDPALAEYAIAQAFGGTRAASAYETRGEAMAANLADGVTPEIVTRFHRSVLELRNASDLPTELFRRMSGVYAAVLPGLGVKPSAVPGGIYFVIGPERQLAAWEEYLRSVEGTPATLHRLYARDFWL